jgi:hypothetical protein
MYTWLLQTLIKGDPFLQVLLIPLAVVLWGGTKKCANGTNCQATDIEVYEHGQLTHKLSKETMQCVQFGRLS